MNFKKTLTSLALGLGLWTLDCQAQLPTYKSSHATGTTAATNIFVPSPQSQIRLVSDIATSDLATSGITYYTGTTAHYVTAGTNANSTTIFLESTNGFGTGSLVYIQGATSNVVMTLSSLATNGVAIMTAAIPFATTNNQEVEILSAGPTYGVGAATNKVYSSEALYVGNYGRAVVAVTTGTSACTNDISAHYDSLGQ